MIKTKLSIFSMDVNSYETNSKSVGQAKSYTQLSSGKYFFYTQSKYNIDWCLWDLESSCKKTKACHWFFYGRFRMQCHCSILFSFIRCQSGSWAFFGSSLSCSCYSSFLLIL